VLSPDPLIDAVRSACARHGHLPEKIREQWASLDTPLYAMLRHQALAQRNMLVMNALGVRVTDNGADRPGQRTERVALPTMPAGPYAQQIIIGAVEMTPPAHSTYRYIPAEEMRQVILNDSLAPADLTSESEQHPPMS
ncbi:MAG: hypothetical protein IVW57_17700, partial [Ktedonobacterales bacterium]|nr:hypothetical protein [Ktedonobacterales bacterium]